MRAPRRSPALIVTLATLVAALAGTALAGTDATTSAINKKKVKKIATNQAIKQINELAPGLSVDHAASADRADSATSANTATNAQRLGGSAPGAFQRTLRWAVVEASPTGASVVRGNATGASRLGVGAYVVSFAPDIRNCAYVATNGDSGAQIAATGELGVEQVTADNPTSLIVRHRDSTGATTDYPADADDGFHIAVLC